MPGVSLQWLWRQQKQLYPQETLHENVHERSQSDEANTDKDEEHKYLVPICLGGDIYSIFDDTKS